MFQTSSPLTLTRIRAYAIALAVVVWTILAVDFSSAGVVDRLGKIKGTDFVHFYVTGTLAREGHFDQLYDLRAHFERARALAPGSPDVLFIPIESPQVALLAAPFTRFSYQTALALWLALLLAVYAGCCVAMWRECRALREHRALAVICCIAFPGIYTVVLHGQLSPFALAAVTAAAIAHRRGWTLTAGAALGILVFKPHWVIAAVAVAAACREWRVVIGAIAGAGAQLAAAIAMVGVPAGAAYWRALESLPRIAQHLEPKPSDSLKGVSGLLMPFGGGLALALYATAAGATLLTAAAIWRENAAYELRYSAFVLAIVLVSPHVGVYDLVLLAPVYFLLANWIARSDDVPHQALLAATLCVSFVAPLLAGLPAFVRLQLTVGPMIALLVYVKTIDAQSRRAVPAADGLPVGVGDRLAAR